MVWFRSSAGVGLGNLFSESRSVRAWIRGGWHVIAAHVLGFVAVTLAAGWNPALERSPHGARRRLRRRGPSPDALREQVRGGTAVLPAIAKVIESTWIILAATGSP